MAFPEQHDKQGQIMATLDQYRRRCEPQRFNIKPTISRAEVETALELIQETCPIRDPHIFAITIYNFLNSHIQIRTDNIGDDKATTRKLTYDTREKLADYCRSCSDEKTKKVMVTFLEQISYISKFDIFDLRDADLLWKVVKNYYERQISVGRKVE